MFGVRNRQLLQRIDRHLDRADERWASMDERWAREDERWASIDEEIRLTREEIRLSREQRDRHAEMFADLRVFTRDMMLRMERVTVAQVEALRDLREEGIAHRLALLRLFDRMGPDDSPSAA